MTELDSVNISGRSNYIRNYDPRALANRTQRQIRCISKLGVPWDTEVPLAAPRYKTFFPGAIKILSIPPITAAANFERKGFWSERISYYPISFTPK
jgi:hypothetical protein